MSEIQNIRLDLSRCAGHLRFEKFYKLESGDDANIIFVRDFKRDFGFHKNFNEMSIIQSIEELGVIINSAMGNLIKHSDQCASRCSATQLIMNLQFPALFRHVSTCKAASAPPKALCISTNSSRPC
jgi:hypothetical protein